nr:UPF0481 protein At3g47200-like [Ipomoea batatas]
MPWRLILATIHRNKVQQVRRGGVGVEVCWKKLKELEGIAESYYGDDIDKEVSGDEFVKMLLLDGCFIVEFVIRSCIRKLGWGQQNGYDDPIYKMISGMESNIVRDMLLLENQLPFFVLLILYDMIRDRGNPEFSEMVKIAFLQMLPKINIFSLLDTEVNTHEDEIKHLLQVVHILCQPQPINNGKKQQQQEEACSSCCFWEQPQQSIYDLCIIRTASELQEAGVHFKKQIFFRNLIAYEQHSWDVRSMYFTDYAMFMDDLINTENDVNLLRLKDVFLSGLGDDK